MKRYILCLFFVCSSFLSCNKFLETVPEDFIAPQNYYNNERELNLALNGVYNRLVDNLGRMYSRGLFTFYVMSDEFFYTGTTSLTNNLKVMDFDANHLDISRLWENIYEGINRANLLLENVDKPDMDETKREIIRGEALFLRGYFYFLLVDIYGEVPLRITSTKSPNDLNLRRSSVAEVYEQITKDMKEAEGLVSIASDYSYNERVTKTAVQAILARVYLTMAGKPLDDVSKYEDALLYVNKVIGSGLHSLDPSYSQIFINHTQDTYNLVERECIWEIGMYGNKANGSEDVAGFVGVENGLRSDNETIGFSGGNVRTTKKLFDSFEAGDLRRDWVIAPYYWRTTNGVAARVFYNANQIYDRSSGKWRREYETLEPKHRSYCGTNFPIIRYSDVLLMKAEVENAIGDRDEAYKALNQVRRRAFGKPINQVDAVADAPAGMVQGPFFEYIVDERFRELCFEGMRKHDLVRWGRYITTMNQLATDIRANAPNNYKFAARPGENITARNVVFPIPNTEITANSLARPQNLGW